MDSLAVARGPEDAQVQYLYRVSLVAHMWALPPHQPGSPLHCKVDS